MPSHPIVYVPYKPSIIVNGVCSSVFVISDKEAMYCDQGEEGLHTYHAAQRVAHEPAWYWKDSNPNAYNDERVLRLEPK